MDNRINTIAGWILFALVAALGLTIGSSMFYHNDKPDKQGYPVESADGEEGGEAAVVEPIANRLAAADAAKGESSFAKCAACHTITQGGAASVGPNLWAALGKPHGHVAGFAYSEGLKAIPGNWTFDAMDAWLTSPRKYAAGTKMTFAGMSDPQERANLIAYMNKMGSNLPLPAPEAAAPAAGPADAATAPAVAGNSVAPAAAGNSAAPAPAEAAPAPAK